jgi:hypothetical protein
MLMNQSLCVAIPLTQAMRDMARRSASRHSSPEKQGQVYRNLLTVQAVETYLARLGVDTDCQESYSYDLAAQLALDVADVMLPGIGRLECRPVQPQTLYCAVPMETWNDRLGYIAVELDAQEARLLGFLPEVKMSSVPLNSFRPLTELFDALVGREHSLGAWLTGQAMAQWLDLRQWRTQGKALAAFLNGSPGIAPIDRTLQDTALQINQLDGAMNNAQDDEAMWTAADRLWQIAPHHPRAGVRRVLDLGLALEGVALALMVGVLPRRDGQVAVLLRVAPIKQVYLPQGLVLAGLYPCGTPFATVEARAADNLIQLKFQAEAGERFSVRLSLGETAITERFVA